MNKREVCFLLGRDGAILWCDASDSPVALPDSRTRWEAIWTRREEIEEIAHSHPVGPSVFSHEDETTMDALTTALGRRLRYTVVSPGGVRLKDQHGDERMLSDEPWWAPLMRAASGMAGR